MSVDTYAAELRVQATDILSAHAELPHQWRQNGTLVIPASSPEGFEVTLRPGDGGIIVFTNRGLHEHFEGEPTEAVTDALALTRDLLSSDMRIRELRAGGGAYRWILERCTDGGWAAETFTALLFWNYFGRRSERIYQNAHLPGRLGRAHDRL